MATTGYTRQARPNIQANLNMNAEDFNAEFDVLASAFDSTSGHDHSGSVTGDGAKIILTSSVSGILPIANGGSGNASATGTGLNVLQTSPTILTPVIANITGPTTVDTTLTVSAGGITVTGNSTITGTLNATTGIKDNSNRVFSASNPFAVGSAQIADPATTTNLIGVMAGLAQSITPTISTRVLIIMTGSMKNNTNADGVQVFLRYGTGAAPANGAAPAGTVVPTSSVGQAFYQVASTNQYGIFMLPAIISGLTLSTTYWIDLSFLAITGGTASLTGISMVAHEI